MMRGLFLVTALLLGCFAFTQTTLAVISTFDTGLEGWTGSGCAVLWQSSQGNPKPSLSSDDNVGDWAQIIAPGKFHGAWPTAGSVSADVKFAGTGTIGYPVVFAITDGNTTYQYVLANPTTSWATYAAALNSANWTNVTSNADWYNWSPPIGNESLATVLTNVTDFRIRTDCVNGYGDFSYLDNIQVVPAPPAVVLLSSGLAGLAVLRRRRR